jgi:polysaccharide biosynthesis/export protein
MLKPILGLLLAFVVASASGRATVDAQAAPSPGAQKPAVPTPAAQKPAVPTAPVPPQAAAAPGYTVGPDDELKIAVFDEPALSGLMRVDSDGTITFPLVGRVMVLGKTVRGVEDHLKQLLEDGFVNRAQVSVEVAAYKSRHVYILGEVRTGGKYPLQGDVTLLELIALAGSLSATAGNDVVIVRPRAGGSVTGPTAPDDAQDAELIRVSLEDLKTGRPSANPTLVDGDTIFVPAAERFYVSGHVRNPGSYVLTRGMTVQQAVTVAGGPTDRGSTRGIKIRRKFGTEYKEITAKLTDPVKADDTIQVRQRFI